MLPTLSHSVFRTPFRLLAGAALAIALTACGGGGGSPGTVPGATTPGTTTPVPPPVTAAKVDLTTSATTMSASGADGTEVTVVAIAKDANNNALPGVTVSFVVSSGTISNTVRVTDANGAVTEKLSTKGNTTARTITITAVSGTATSPTREVVVVATSSAQPKLLVTASNGTLNSSGAVGTAVAIRALVLDTSNVVVPGALVTFSSDSGALSAATRTTDVNGLAVVNLDTGTDPTSRVINVTASISGAPASVVQVNVAGTKLTINAPVSVNVDSRSDVTVVLTDSSNQPIPNRAVTFSATRNPVTTKAGGPSPSVTDSTGRLVLTYAASTAGADSIIVRALGETATAAVTVVASNFSVAVVDGAGAIRSLANTGVCYPVAIRNFVGTTPQAGTVSVSASRGTVYTAADCATAVGAPVPLVSGVATVYIRANSPGVSTLTATSSATNSTVQGTVEFVSPLIAQSVITLQVSPSTVGANLAGSSTEQAVLRALVTDRPSSGESPNVVLGNPVKGARVAFSIVSDSSGGTLSQPSEVLTGADGIATVSYIAGTTSTALNGVQIAARVISDVNTATASASLTVAQRSLFISAGTGNTILLPSSTTYQLDYVVVVSDAAGNAAPNVRVVASVIPRSYRKGIMVLASPTGPWVPAYSVPSPYCLNEDRRNYDGVLGLGEDENGNGRLDPVIPMTITGAATTDARGLATFSLVYPRDRAYWIDVDLTFAAQVAGSESKYVGYTVLPGAGSDYNNAAVTPPGAFSPYGVASTCSVAN